jgi:hypothetical protein
MKKMMYLLLLLFVCGCAAPTQQGEALRHETYESSLLTEQEFMARVSQTATLVFESMQAVSDAANRYALDNDGRLPPGTSKSVKALLLDGGYLETWPTLPPFAFTDPVHNNLVYVNGLDDMDGFGALDDGIHAKDLKIEVCESFISRYSSFGTGDIIHKYEANGDRYPGEYIGRHMLIYAINWGKQSGPEYCDIIWVMQYN